MKKQIINKSKEEEIKFNRYKKLIRNLRRGKVEKISYKQIDNNFSKK